ncbi:MAG: transcriptional regulator with GAF, ATPase, and Fis domain, partial [Myxococcota bacterium]
RRYPSAVAVIESLGQHSGVRFASETRSTMAARIRGGRLVGQKAVLSEMEAALGASRSVLLVGPPGSGKSRLVAAWRQAHQVVGGVAVVGNLDTLIRAVVARLGDSHPLVHHHDEVVRRLLGKGRRSLGPTQPQDAILRDRDAVLQLLEAGLPAGSVVVVDDVDSADRPTRQMAAMLLEARGPALLLTACREEPATSDSGSETWASAIDTGRLEPIEIPPWDEAAVQEAIRDAFDGSTVADVLAPAIHQVSEGNPRFVEEVLGSLVDRGEVRRGDGGQWIWDSKGHVPVPRELVTACRQRVESLPVDARRLLRLVALADGPIPMRVIRSLPSGELASLLVDRALVRLDNDGSVLDCMHGAIREAALADRSHVDLNDERRILVAAVEAEVPLTDRPAAFLSRAFETFGEPVRALEYALAAAGRAERRWDVDEAITWLSKADRLLDACRISDGRLVDTLRRLAIMLRFTGKTDDESVVLDRLAMAAQAAGSLPDQLETTALKARFWFDRGRLDLAGQLCEGQIAIAREVPGRLPLSRLLWVLAMVSRAQGDTDSGLRLSEEALDLLGDDTSPEAVDLRVQNHINRGNAFGQTGRLDRAETAFDNALALCRRHGMVSSAIVCTMNLGICYALQCRYGPAQSRFDAARSEARRLGWGELRDVLAANQAEVECHLGLWSTAAARARRLLTRKRSESVEASARCTLAACELAMGDRAAAAGYLPSDIETAPVRARFVTARLGEADGTSTGLAQAHSVLTSVRDGPFAPHDRALAASRLAALALASGDVAGASTHIAEAEELAGNAAEVREGRCERLAIGARVSEASGETDQALEWLTTANAQLQRECLELSPRLRRAYLRAEFRLALQSDSQRLLGANPKSDGTTQNNLGLARTRYVLGLSHLLTRAPRLPDVAEAALDVLLRCVPADRATILTRRDLDTDGWSFVALTGRRAGQSPVDASAFVPADRLLAVMMRMQAMVGEPAGASGTRLPFKRLVVPLVYGGRVIAAMYLESESMVDALDDEQVALVEAVANQTAMAVQHHVQIEEIERLRRQTEADLTRTRARLSEEAARRERAERAVEAERSQVKLRFDYDQIIFRSGAMGAVLRKVDRLVDQKITVLVEGESGTGKELIARALHYSGPRTSGPFVALNCGAIPANLIESELFGHVRGAFTGAHAQRRGCFEMAHRGTLFLDEIGEVSPDVQVRLLRVLESSEVSPVGGNKCIPVDVRIVAATNRNLAQEVEAGRFREDLFYRINVVGLRLPPLRERL